MATAVNCMHPTGIFLLSANEVCEGYVFTGVCLCVVGGHAWQGVVCVPHTAPWQILRPWHTVNERVVRILLECILVY